MDDLDFLKEFGKNLDRERPHDASAADWTDLESRLDGQDLQKKRSRRFAGWFWPMATTAGFLFFGTAFWQMQTKINRLENELAACPGGNILKNDTTFQHFSVVKYDTIFRTVMLRREVRETFQNENLAENKNENQTQNLIQNQPENQTQNLIQNKNATQNLTQNQPENKSAPGSDFLKKQENQNDFAQKQAENGDNLKLQNTFSQNLAAEKTGGKTENPAAKNATLALAPLPSLARKPLEIRRKNHLPDLGLVMFSVPEESRHDKITRRFRPQNAAVGLRGGMVFPQTKIAQPGNSFAVGLTGEMAFGRRLRVIAGADFSRTNFRVKPDDLTSSNIPAPAPPAPNDVLDEVAVQQPVLDFLLGLRYDFLDHKPLRPFFSAAWVGEQTREQSLKYEYKNAITHTENAVFIPRNDANFDVSGLQIGLGADFFFQKRWSFGAGIFYQKHFSTSVPLLGERFGARAGVNYHF